MLEPPDFISKIPRNLWTMPRPRDMADHQYYQHLMEFYFDLLEEKDMTSQTQPRTANGLYREQTFGSHYCIQFYLPHVTIRSDLMDDRTSAADVAAALRTLADRIEKIAAV